MTQGFNLCWACKRLREESVGDPIQTGTCDAYPLGIPLEIFAEGYDHRNSFPGDNGLRFEPIDETFAEDAVSLLQEFVKP